MPKDMWPWRKAHKWTKQRNWIRENDELDLQTFRQELNFQDELVKMSMVAEYNFLFVKRLEIQKKMKALETIEEVNKT